MPQLTPEQLHDFLKLVEFDKEILDLQNDKKRIEKEQSNLEFQLKNLADTFKYYQDRFQQNQKQVNLLELETKSLDSNLSQKINKLDRTSSPKEYFAIQDEIEALKKSKIDLDNQLLSSWTSLESAEEDFKKHENNYKGEETKLVKEQFYLSERLKLTETKIASLEKNRLQIEQPVEPEILKYYKSLKEKVSMPVAKAISNTCSACSFSISTLDIQKLLQNQLIFCKECFRLLYLPQASSSSNSNLNPN